MLWFEGQHYICGEDLIKLVDAVLAEELPVDPTWAAGLRYSKRLIKNMMGVEQENGKAEEEQGCKQK